MANIKAAIKDIRKSGKRERNNSRIKTRIKKAVKKFNILIESNTQEAKETLPRINKLLDKASKKNILKSNNASRRVARLTKRLNTALNAKDNS
jgi:small subunit ribosomal protein S20